jgi:hypothetical protein
MRRKHKGPRFRLGEATAQYTANYLYNLSAGVECFLYLANDRHDAFLKLCEQRVHGLGDRFTAFQINRQLRGGLETSSYASKTSE